MRYVGQEVFLLENKIGQIRLIGLDKLAHHKDRVQVQVGHPRRREKLIDGASDAGLGIPLSSCFHHAEITYTLVDQGGNTLCLAKSKDSACPAELFWWLHW